MLSAEFCDKLKIYVGKNLNMFWKFQILQQNLDSENKFSKLIATKSGNHNSKGKLR